MRTQLALVRPYLNYTIMAACDGSTADMFPSIAQLLAAELTYRSYSHWLSYGTVRRFVYAGTEKLYRINLINNKVRKYSKPHKSHPQ